MDAPTITYLIATSLRPVLRQTAHQLTLLGLVVDTDDYSQKWLGNHDAYQRLSAFTLLELASVVHSLEFGLGLQECIYQDEWEVAKTDTARWQSRVRLSALRVQLVRLRKWKRESGWQALMFD
ncbi:hypothetical protein [uncultured Devosia sp.]|uniref:hypothetical protein n=1 Tax=uncultured Devosia sp. TaxID=211434 RepID=UPI0035CAE34D